jgi:hypothetical protein
MAAVRHPPVLKEGDLVFTPTGRMAKVIGIGQNGERELRYVDLAGEEVTLRVVHLRLISSAPIRPWKIRVLR